jgi:hypothetical protein
MAIGRHPPAPASKPWGRPTPSTQGLLLVCLAAAAGLLLLVGGPRMVGVTFEKPVGAVC